MQASPTITPTISLILATPNSSKTSIISHNWCPLRCGPIRASSAPSTPTAPSPSTSTSDSSDKLNKYSSRITEPKSQGGSQAILYGVGLTDDDLHKPQVGISSVWFEGNTCNMHLLSLAEAVKGGVRDAGMVGFVFNTIGVSDAISQGTRGMCYSLQSRDLIADSIETVMSAQWYDGNISIPGCDKNVSVSIVVHQLVVIVLMYCICIGATDCVGTICFYVLLYVLSISLFKMYKQRQIDVLGLRGNHSFLERGALRYGGWIRVCDSPLSGEYGTRGSLLVHLVRQFKTSHIVDIHTMI